MGHDRDELRQPRVNLAAEELRLGFGREQDILVGQQLGLVGLPDLQRRGQGGAIRPGAAGINPPDLDLGAARAEARDDGRGVTDFATLLDLGGSGWDAAVCVMP